ncbi:MAG: SpoIIE family protein phosphatase, partial [Chloroflexus sp.]
PPEATLVLYSDGLMEARRRGKPWGREGLREAVEECAAQGMMGQALLEALVARWQEWLEDEPEDDSTLVVISRRG